MTPEELQDLVEKAQLADKLKECGNCRWYAEGGTPKKGHCVFVDKLGDPADQPKGSDDVCNLWEYWKEC